MNNLASVMRILIFFLLLGQNAELFADPVDNSSPHQAVRDAARQYVFERVTALSSEDTRLDVMAAEVDERLQVPQCDTPFTAQASENSLTQSNVTVKVSCPANNWFLYVMVKVRQVQPVVVTKVPISPGTLLDDTQLEVVEMELGQLRSTTYSAVEELTGARSKRRLRPGQPIEPGLLCYVCKGDSIVIRAAAAGLFIKTSGVAQQDGNIGDTILVKNASSDKLIGARVVSAMEVAVGI